MRRFVSACGLVAGGAIAACGDNLPPLPDATAAPQPFRTAPHVPMPAMSDHAKVVLAHVQLVTVTFEDDAARAQAEAFGDAVVRSAWYATVGEDYRLAPPDDKPAQRLRLGPAPPAVTRDDLAALVPARPSDDDEVLYLVYVPAAVQRAPDLRGVRGYHDVVMRGERAIPFAVVLEDDAADPFALTANAGRQLINAVTSPFRDPRDGYYLDPLMTDPWSLVAGAPADLCAGEDPIVEGGIAYPRVYSSAFAERGFPCKPGLVEEPWSDVTAKPARLANVRRGNSITFELTGWSTHESADWQLELRVAERSGLTLAEMRPVLGGDTINNGRVVTLTLQVPAEAEPGTAGGVMVLSGVARHPWAVGLVVQ
jgi:hypothetical protein